MTRAVWEIGPSLEHRTVMLSYVGPILELVHFEFDIVIKLH